MKPLRVLDPEALTVREWKRLQADGFHVPLVHKGGGYWESPLVRVESLAMDDVVGRPIHATQEG